jgi:hypothetical protein
MADTKADSFSIRNHTTGLQPTLIVEHKDMIIAGPVGPSNPLRSFAIVDITKLPSDVQILRIRNGS